MSSNETKTKQNSPEPGTWHRAARSWAGRGSLHGCNGDRGTELGQLRFPWAPLSSHVLPALWAPGSDARRAAISPRSILRNPDSAPVC